jgi:hypothetical protein
VAKSTWISTAYPNLPAQAVVVAGNVDSLAPTEDGVYLHHGTGALALTAYVQNLLDTHVAGSNTVGITKGGRFFMSNDTGAFTWTFTDALLRTLLGYTGNLSGAQTYVATNQSPLLWRAGRRGSPRDAILGVNGAPVFDVAANAAPTGRQRVRSFGENTVNLWEFRYVSKGRYRETTLTNEHFLSWYRYAGIKAWKWILFREVEEEDGSNDAASLSSQLGPYEVDVSKVPARFQMERGIENKDELFHFDIPVLVPPEHA